MKIQPWEKKEKLVPQLPAVRGCCWGAGSEIKVLQNGNQCTHGCLELLMGCESGISWRLKEPEAAARRRAGAGESRVLAGRRGDNDSLRYGNAGKHKISLLFLFVCSLISEFQCIPL